MPVRSSSQSYQYSQQQMSLPPVPIAQQPAFYQQPVKSASAPPRCHCPLTTARCNCCRCSRIDLFASPPAVAVAARDPSLPRNIARSRMSWSDRRFARDLSSSSDNEEEEDEDEDYWRREDLLRGGATRRKQEEAEAPEWLNVEKSVRFRLPPSSTSGSRSATLERGRLASPSPPPPPLPPPAPLSSKARPQSSSAPASKPRRPFFFSRSSHEIDRDCQQEEEFIPTPAAPNVIVKTPLKSSSHSASLTAGSSNSQSSSSNTEKATKKTSSSSSKGSFAQRFLHLGGGGGDGGAKKKSSSSFVSKTLKKPSSGSAPPSSPSSGGSGGGASTPPSSSSSSAPNSGGEGSDPGYESDPAERKKLMMMGGGGGDNGSGTDSSSPSSSAAASPLVGGVSSLQQQQHLPHFLQQQQQQQQHHLSPVTMELFVPIRVSGGHTYHMYRLNLPLWYQAKKGFFVVSFQKHCAIGRYCLSSVSEVLCLTNKQKVS